MLCLQSCYHRQTGFPTSTFISVYSGLWSKSFNGFSFCLLIKQTSHLTWSDSGPACTFRPHCTGFRFALHRNSRSFIVLTLCSLHAETHVDASSSPVRFQVLWPREAWPPSLALCCGPDSPQQLLSAFLPCLIFFIAGHSEVSVSICLFHCLSLHSMSISIGQESGDVTVWLTGVCKTPRTLLGTWRMPKNVSEWISKSCWLTSL